MSVDLGVAPGVLKKGAGDILGSLEVVKDLKLKDLAEEGEALGDEEAASALVTFTATWELGAKTLTECALDLADGLNSADSDYQATDQRIREAVDSVKSELR
ncbi:hypothetical protein [Streptomyces sp. NPDC002176]|uniref:hypothetical protein n=1 Tax=Streptomyces sp. NPDC002176 TaxID=3364634 RepID=UPI00384B366B